MGRSAWIAIALAAGAAVAPLASMGGCSGSAPNAANRQSGARDGATPPNFRLARQRALEAAAEDEPELAISLYREAVNAFPGLGAAWNNLGVLLMEQERYLEAAEAFASAAEESPTDPRPLYNLGLTWDRSFYYEEALRIYLRALERDRTYLPALRGAIRAETLIGDTNEGTLERIRLALLRETDQRWRQFFQLQRASVEEDVTAERRRRAGVPRPASEEPPAGSEGGAEDEGR